MGLNYHTIKEMYGRDIKILIVLATVVNMIVHYSSLFQYFLLSIYYRPYSSWNFLIFVY